MGLAGETYTLKENVRTERIRTTRVLQKNLCACKHSVGAKEKNKNRAILKKSRKRISEALITFYIN